MTFTTAASSLLPAQARSRRSLLRAAPAGMLVALGVGRSAQAAPRYTVPRENIEAAVAQRFPLHYPVGGLVNLVAQAPRIGLRPEYNRLQADMALEAGGPLLRKAYRGRLALEFGLRYEPKDRTLRAHDVQIHGLDFPDLPPEVALLLSQYAPQIARQSLGEVVLHTFAPDDLALTDGLGMQPGAITVTPQGLAVELVPKPLF